MSFLCCAALRAPEGLERAREMTPCERRPGDKADACVVAETVHFALFFAVEETVVVLHWAIALVCISP